MARALRKITRSKWPSDNYDQANIGDLSADAITSCLRTSSNKLSIWEIDSREKIGDIVAALASTMDHLDGMCVVYLKSDDVAELDLEVEHAEVYNPIREVSERHRDITGLTYKSLGSFASLIVIGLRDSQMIQYSKGNIKKLLKEFILSRRLEIMDLKPNLREEMAAYLKLTN